MKLSLYNSKELDFVELNITGSEMDYNKIDPESSYIDSVIFNLFTECFEKSNNLYEYYEATKYNPRYIITLRNQLLTYLTTIQGLRDLSGFQSFIDQKLFGKKFLLELVQCDKNWTDHWSVYHEKLVNINQEIIDLVDFCIDEDRILWVIGY